MWQVAGSQRQSSKADLWVVNADHCLRTRSICQLLRILVTDLTFGTDSHGDGTYTISVGIGAYMQQQSLRAQKQIYESGTFLEKSLNPNYFFLAVT